MPSMCKPCLLAAVVVTAMPLQALAAPPSASVNETAFSETAPPQTTRTVRLEVSSTFEGDERAVFEREVGERVRTQLMELEVWPSPVDETRLAVKLGWHDEERTTYAVAVSLTRVDEVLAEDALVCEFCSTGELFDAIARSVDEVVAKLEAPPEPPAPSPAPTASEPRPHPIEHAQSTPVDHAPGSERTRRLSRVGWAGVGLLGAGVAVAATGGGLWSLGERERRGDDPRTAVRDFRSPGIGLVATGACVATAGVIMIIVDAVRGSKPSGSSRTRRWQIGAGPGLAGMAAGRRF